MDEFETPQMQAWLDQEDRHVIETIRRHGCYLQAVLGECSSPPFAYTVGLFGLGHPELIVFGLGTRSAAQALNWFFARVREGSDLMPGEIIRPEEAAPRFLVEPFPNPAEFLFAANRHYQRPDEATVPAYQLTWDVNGAFPGEPGYPNPAWWQPRPGEAVAWRP